MIITSQPKDKRFPDVFSFIESCISAKTLLPSSLPFTLIKTSKASVGLFRNTKDLGVSGTKNKSPKNKPAGITSEANIHLQPTSFNQASEPPPLEIK